VLTRSKLLSVSLDCSVVTEASLCGEEGICEAALTELCKGESGNAGITTRPSAERDIVAAGKFQSITHYIWKLRFGRMKYRRHVHSRISLHRKYQKPFIAFEFWIIERK